MARIAYLQDAQTQATLHEEACALLKKLGANTNPVNYKLAYEYCIGTESVVEKVNKLIQSNQALSDITAIRFTQELFGKKDVVVEEQNIHLTNSVMNVFDFLSNAMSSQTEWIEKLKNPQEDHDHVIRIVSKISKKIDGKIAESIDDFKRIRSKSAETNPMIYMDILTRLKNKMHCEQMLPEIVRLKGDKVLMLALFDISNFDEFNSQHGIYMGDSLLNAYARILDKYRKEHNGFVWRVGCDEFLLAIVSNDEQRVISEIMTLHEALQHVRFEKKKIYPKGISTTFCLVNSSFEKSFRSLKAQMMRNKNSNEVLQAAGL